QLTAIVPFLPLLDLGHLTTGIFEHELGGVRVQDTRKIVAVAALEAGAPKAVAEADVEASFAATPAVAWLNRRAISFPETLPRAGSSSWMNVAPASTPMQQVFGVEVAGPLVFTV